MNNPVLKKTCKICGLQKSLSAFLQLSNQQGSVYGDICSNCRKTNLDRVISEETTTSKTDHRIGHKEKVAKERENKKQHKEIEENYYKERDKEVEESIIDTDKKEILHKKEKKHRKTFLEKIFFNPKRAEFNQPPHDNADLTIDKEINFINPVIDTTIPKLKHQSVVFKRFKTWLGSSAPIVAATEKLMNNNNPDIEKTSSEFIEKKWPPSKPSGK